MEGIRFNSPSAPLPRLGLDFHFSHRLSRLHELSFKSLPYSSWGTQPSTQQRAPIPSCLCHSSTQPPVTAFFVSSLEEAVFKALSSLLQNRLGTTGGARHEFYDKFQR